MRIINTIIFIVDILLLLFIFIFQAKKFNKTIKNIIHDIEERKINTDLRINEINDSISNFELTTKKDIDLVRIEFADIQVKNNVNFQSVQSQLDNNRIELDNNKIEFQTICDNIKNATLAQFKNNDEKISVLADSIKTILAENKRLQKQLEFYTEIKSDSMNLNADGNAIEQDQLLEKALTQIKNQFSSTDKTENTTFKNIKPTISSIEMLSTEESAVESAELIDETISTHELTSNVSILDNEQKATYYLMENTKTNIFVTGKAGTGKSFLLNLFRLGTKKNVLVLAPTGISALNAHGVTIHSAFGFDNLVKLKVEEIYLDTIQLNTEKKQTLKMVEVIIIDEISMVRSDTFEKIDRILKVLNNNQLPFGGKQIILFGDLFQLPPIAKAAEIKYLQDIYGGIYFFYSNRFLEGDFKFVELTINHRQKDDTVFFDILNKIRDGIISKKDLTILNSRINTNDAELRRVIRLFPKKDKAEQINSSELAKINGKEYVYKCKILYNDNDMVPNLENVFPVTEILTLKKGALVMLVTNDPNRRWVNGTLGIVSDLASDFIKVDINGFTYEIPPATFEQQEATYINGKITYETILKIEQYPIVLAYAITIHKSQGMTYKQIACDISDCFAPGQAYVALSRCSSLEGLHLLNEVNENILTVENDVKEFYHNQKNSKK